MRIAFLCYRGNMKSGGQGIYLHALTRELARRGHEIDCFVGPPYPDPMPWARVHKIENQQFWGRRFQGRDAILPRPHPFRIFTPLNFFEYAASGFGFLPEPFAFSVRSAQQLIRHIRAGVHYDMVHDIQSLGYGLLWLRALGLPSVATIHHPLTVDRRWSLLRDQSFMDRKGSLTFYPVRTQGRVARRLDAIITSSQCSSVEIQHGFGVVPERIHNVWNGVVLPDPRPLEQNSKSTEVLFVGRCFDPNKGFEYLIDALALLPEAVTLRVLDDCPAHTALADQIDARGVRGRIRFDGKVSQAELHTRYRCAAVVAVPSLFEGFGLPAIEALAAGTPVVASHAGALPEVLDTAGAGSLVPCRDPAALAKAILDIMHHWPEHHEQALAQRNTIETAFGWPQVAARTESVYHQVMEACASST